MRRSATWSRLSELDAVFGEKAGWERVNWFGVNESDGDGALRPDGWAGQIWSPAIEIEREFGLNDWDREYRGIGGFHVRFGDTTGSDVREFTAPLSAPTPPLRCPVFHGTRSLAHPCVVVSSFFFHVINRLTKTEKGMLAEPEKSESKACLNLWDECFGLDNI